MLIDISSRNKAIIIIIIIIIIISTWIFENRGLAKISTVDSTTWQFKTLKLIQRPIKSFHLTPDSQLMVPRSIPTTPSLKWPKFKNIYLVN